MGAGDPAHAAHLSGAPYAKSKREAKIGVGEHITKVKRIFRPILNVTDLDARGRDTGYLFKDGERFKIGEFDVEVMHTPAHTPADISGKIENAVFAGDTLFMCHDYKAPGRDTYA